MSFIDEKLLSILCCPECRGELVLRVDKLICHAEERSFEIVDGIPVFSCDQENPWDIDISIRKWHEFHKDFNWLAGMKHYENENLPYIMKYLNPIRKGDKFLEIGGGASYLSFNMVQMGVNVVIVDFDLDILKIARKNFIDNGCQGFFVCANVNKLPFKDNLFDLSAGIGVIEHSKQVADTIQELYRITKKNGYTFQIIPSFSLLTLVNNALRFGTYTPYRILNKLISFLHVTVFQAKYMKYGYEESYNSSFMKDLLQKKGFKNVEVDFYEYNQTILKKFGFLSRKFFYKLVRYRFFWDVIYLKAFK